MELKDIFIYIVGAVLLGLIAAIVTRNIFVGIVFPVLLLVGGYLYQLVKPEMENSPKEEDKKD
jgi:MFS-type transporter involved in bile tolerance (Atg22 family)